ncbi:hypothetical protein TSTA_062340 [Talaromyces stipitatus ATCC 10500]|uniref:Uncharacterized protein n=1 Tax=Talaromyces stipitatus (strain ATCC 10500 / CBS 375.48 / QM 6759 / NRRL 1006) TaxID=441959 RepID=B8LXT2_TALSN|nr:uncharacterized protein TSTA_062340 [Talaromyces stipitatus ATCC 10500]XP_002488825.1 uncharacterized protein TSTA_080290 [Talaromyces stipitatus ATCC 10500]EED11415.1 conserved hypothetical protein [Talaromyces stipitatus ATCC 10500]EED22747.1 hypothetical protein TSTA_062340 [Talaromyces stipitatus ATCC 10500]
MQRRVLRMRLYHWYMELQKELKVPEKRPALRRGEKIQTKAIDMILKDSYLDWEGASDLEKKSYRDEFHRNKDVGLKWCTLVQYFGEGIAVICGKEMDLIINDTKFKPKSLHALATFVLNFYPDVPHICRLFGFPLKFFIQDIGAGPDEYHNWQHSLDQEGAIIMVNSGLKGPQVPSEPPSTWIVPDCLEMDLTGFIRGVLKDRRRRLYPAPG